MKTLLHLCCAPCSICCIEALREEGIEPVGYWYNPNIHPLTEYRLRRDALVSYAGRIGLALATKDEYGLREFIAGIAPDFEDRCAFCYRVRLDAAAKYAAENGFDCFSTSLLISPYQNHDLLRRTAEEAAALHGVGFLYRDFRPRFREGQARARALPLYLQKYCGCIFSEEERYRKKGDPA